MEWKQIYPTTSRMRSFIVFKRGVGRSVGRSVGRVAWLGLAPRREEKDGRPGPLEEEMFSEMEAKANDTHGNVFIHQT